MQARNGTATSVLKAYLALLTATVVWGAAFVAARVVMQTVPPLGLAGLRFLIAAVFFVILLLVRRPDRQSLCLRDMPLMVLMGIVGVTILFPIQFAGLDITGAAISSILVLGSSPMWVSVLASLVLHEPMTRRKILAILIGAVGVLVVVSQANLQLGSGIGFVIGCLMGLGSSACWAVYSVAGRRALRRNSPLTVSALANIVGGIGLLPLALFSGQWATVPQLTAGQWLLVLYLGLVCSGFGHILYYYGLTRVEASRASVLSYLQLVISVVAGVILLGEVITWHTVVGGLVIVFAVYLTMSEFGPRRPAAPREPLFRARICGRSKSVPADAPSG